VNELGLVVRLGMNLVR